MWPCKKGKQISSLGMLVICLGSVWTGHGVCLPSKIFWTCLLQELYLAARQIIQLVCSPDVWHQLLGNVCSSQLPIHLHGPSTDGYQPWHYSSQDLCPEVLQMWWLWPFSRSVSLSPGCLTGDGWDDKEGNANEAGSQDWLFQGPPHSPKQINGFTVEERVVTTTSRTDAHSLTANECMSAAAVSRSTLLPNEVLVVPSLLHLHNFCKYLANHPDQAWCSKLLKGIEHGVNIGFEGERTSIITNNWKSALDHPEVIMEFLSNEVAAGCKAGPLTQPPFSDLSGHQWT